MKKTLICLLIAAVPGFLLAQKKNFTYDQLFKGAYPKILQELPEISEWLDDDTYLESRNHSLYAVNAVTGASKPYTSREPQHPQVKGARNITLSPDKKSIAYTKEDNNLYVKDIATGRETRLTSDGSKTIMNGYASWIYYEEILGRSSEYAAFWWSPDSRQIAYMRFDDSPVPVFPIYVADGTHGYLENTRYPKAGDPNPEVKIGVTGITRPSTVWVDFNAKRDQYFGRPYWNPGNELFVQWMNRGQDTLTIYKVNNTTGAKKQIYQEVQPTWVVLEGNDRLSFVKEGFILKSDRDGWENLYLYDHNGKLINPITSGNYWGTEILGIDEKNKLVYVRARKENSARFDIYKVPMDGKEATRLSFGEYSFDNVKISPNGKHMVATWSNLQTPPVMGVLDNSGKMVREIINAKGKEFDDYFIPQTRIITVKSADGHFDLPVAITYPAHFDSTKKYPVWISVYGGPNSGTVYDRWKPVGGPNQLFAQEGVINIAMDNRSSGHFGRKGINYIFKQLGKYEIEDYMHCARWIRSQPWADASKIGITGGSFGGYITCMALTYGADVFTHGIALYSVTDWKLYDSHYTERFMKTPKENPEGYANTSAMKYAGNYKGVLRIVHGSTDDNVHMQNTMQLIDRLQDLGKSFEMMIYPNQRHGIRGIKGLHNVEETVRFVRNKLK